ncbi:MAG: cupin domain-containing protein [Woeseiaceae bacterium]|nr:cupin domain-containing protein [Woeseiaceae bacterium]
MKHVKDIASTFVVVDRQFAADTVDVTDNLWAEIDERFGDFAGRTLISSFSFDEDWPTWEVHPHGDEFVCLLSGDAEMTLALPDGDETVRLTEPGSFVIVPQGTWHTARVNAPTTMLFVTPGQGTENRERPRREN